MASKYSATCPGRKPKRSQWCGGITSRPDGAGFARHRARARGRRDSPSQTIDEITGSGPCSSLGHDAGDLGALVAVSENTSPVWPFVITATTPG